MSEHIYVDRTTTWHAIGKDVQECKNMEQVLRKSGLDYEVTKLPVFTGDGLSIPNRFVTARPEIGGGTHLYDVVSDKFQIVQNREAFEFVDYMGDELQFEKAGETSNGMVYIIGKLPSVNILGDEFTPHVLFRNGFSGKIKITAAICPLRLVCQNQFNFAFKNAQNSVTIRHVSNAGVRLSEARDVLRANADYMDELNRMAQKYAAVKLSKAEVERVIGILFPIPEDTSAVNSYKLHQLEDARSRFIRAYTADDNQNFNGTGWGLVNAYTDFITHRPAMGKAETKNESKFTMVTFNPNAMAAIVSALQMVKGVTI